MSVSASSARHRCPDRTMRPRGIDKVTPEILAMLSQPWRRGAATGAPRVLEYCSNTAAILRDRQAYLGCSTGPMASAIRLSSTESSATMPSTGPRLHIDGTKYRGRGGNIRRPVRVEIPDRAFTCTWQVDLGLRHLCVPIRHHSCSGIAARRFGPRKASDARPR